MLIKRTIFSYIKEAIAGEPKILLLYGPRQAGKTTLLQELAKELDPAPLMFNGDDIRVQETWRVPNLEKLTQTTGLAQTIIIDEAQRIENIGLSLKLIYDAHPRHIIASGSSSFDLANRVNEPLTGRASLFTLYPLSYREVPLVPPDPSRTAKLEEFLRFGLYPKVVTLSGEQEKQRYLQDLVNTYLYRDLLTFGTIRKPKKVIDLLSLLALQIGSEVSIQELAQNVSLSKMVVEKYLDVLEKMFVVINVRGFSRNLRKEISKTSKYYFVDLGLRNALIGNFNPLHIRSDTGALFENFAIMERIKSAAHHRKNRRYFFWRTYDQKEIDLIEEWGGKLLAFECKWSPTSKTKRAAAAVFTTTYHTSTFHTVTPATLDTFLP